MAISVKYGLINLGSGGIPATNSEDIISIEVTSFTSSGNLQSKATGARPSAPVICSTFSLIVQVALTGVGSFSEPFNRKMKNSMVYLASIIG